MFFSEYSTKIFRYLLIFSCLIFISENKLFSQTKFPKVATHTETIKTDDGYIKVNILDRSKKKIIVKENYIYYWYTEPNIHYTNGGYSGKLLHGVYTAFYKSDNLKEQGCYKYGLKTGAWKKWYPTGILNTVTEYRDGIKNGCYREYDGKGNLVLSAKYKNGLLHGNYNTYKDGNVIDRKKYKNGNEVVPKEKQSRIKTSDKDEKKSVTPEKSGKTKDKGEKKEKTKKQGEKKCFMKDFCGKIKRMFSRNKSEK